jgi:hypothetical protein
VVTHLQATNFTALPWHQFTACLLKFDASFFGGLHELRPLLTDRLGTTLYLELGVMRRPQNQANALKHGVFAKMTILPWEDANEFNNCTLP